jgi:hypothetical protein
LLLREPAEVHLPRGIPHSSVSVVGVDSSFSEDEGELLVDEGEDGCVFRFRKGRSQLDFEGSFVICFRDEVGDKGIGEEGIGLMG